MSMDCVIRRVVLTDIPMGTPVWEGFVLLAERYNVSTWQCLLSDDEMTL